MEELIKEAERLYKNIDDIQLMWVKSTKDSYEEGKIFAIGLMHATMNSVSQFLKCLIDRKDNIVDLGELIHKTCEVPPKNGKVVLINPRPNEKCSSLYVSKDKGLETYYKINYPMYIYLDDLMPKGGE